MFLWRYHIKGIFHHCYHHLRGIFMPVPTIKIIYSKKGNITWHILEKRQNYLLGFFKANRKNNLAILKIIRERVPLKSAPWGLSLILLRSVSPPSGHRTQLQALQMRCIRRHRQLFAPSKRHIITGKCSKCSLLWATFYF